MSGRGHFYPPPPVRARPPAAAARTQAHTPGWPEVSRLTAPSPWERVASPCFQEGYVVVAADPVEGRAELLSLGPGGVAQAMGHMREAAEGAVKRGDEQTRLYAGVRVCVSLAPAGAVAQRLVALALTPGEADTEVDEPMADVSDSAAPGAAEAASDDAFSTDARAFFAGAHALVAFDAADCSGGSALAAAAETAVARALREADGDVREVDCDARALAEQREVVEYAWDAACGAGDPRVGCASLAAAERALATLGGAGTGAGAAPGAQPPLHARAARVAAALEAAAAEAELEEAATAARDSVQLAEAAKAIADVRQVRAEEQKRGAVAIGGSALPKAEGAVHAAVLAAGIAGRDHAKAVERLVVAEMRLFEARAAATSTKESDAPAADAAATIAAAVWGECSGEALLAPVASLRGALEARTALGAQPPARQRAQAAAREAARVGEARRRAQHVDGLYHPAAFACDQ